MKNDRKTRPSRTRIACAILDLYHRGEFPSPGAVNIYLHDQVEDNFVYMIRRDLVRTGKLDLSTIDRPANQLGTKR